MQINVLKKKTQKYKLRNCRCNSNLRKINRTAQPTTGLEMQRRSCGLANGHFGNRVTPGKISGALCCSCSHLQPRGSRWTPGVRVPTRRGDSLKERDRLTPVGTGEEETIITRESRKRWDLWQLSSAHDTKFLWALVLTPGLETPFCWFLPILPLSPGDAKTAWP